jgi:hypothetical protein
MGHKKQKSIPNDEIKATQDSSNVSHIYNLIYVNLFRMLN